MCTNKIIHSLGRTTHCLPNGSLSVSGAVLLTRSRFLLKIPKLFKECLKNKAKCLQLLSHYE